MKDQYDADFDKMDNDHQKELKEQEERRKKEDEEKQEEENKIRMKLDRE